MKATTSGAAMRTEKIKRYRVNFFDKVSVFGEWPVQHCIMIDDGTYKGIIDYDGDDPDFIENLLYDDPNVVSYSAENR